MEIKILTPEKTIFSSNEVTSVTLPTPAGIITVLEDHTPIVTNIIAGEILVEFGDSQSEELAVSSGILKISKNDIVLLVESAEVAGEIDVDRAQKAKEDAESYLANLQDTEDVEFAAIQAKIQKELARITVGMRRRRV